MLHLHPLRSRVRDMEHKLKVAMDNLIRGVKLASSPRSPPGELQHAHTVLKAALFPKLFHGSQKTINIML